MFWKYQTKHLKWFAFNLQFNLNIRPCFGCRCVCVRLSLHLYLARSLCVCASFFICRSVEMMTNESNSDKHHDRTKPPNDSKLSFTIYHSHCFTFYFSTATTFFCFIFYFCCLAVFVRLFAILCCCCCLFFLIYRLSRRYLLLRTSNRFQCKNVQWNLSDPLSIASNSLETRKKFNRRLLMFASQKTAFFSFISMC